MIGILKLEGRRSVRVKPIITGTAVLTLAVGACSANSKTPPTVASMPPASPATAAPMTSAPMQAHTDSSQPTPPTRSGMFEGLNGKHVGGKVTVTGSTLEFSNFSSDEGPDLRAYLTTGTTEADVVAGMPVAAITFNQASQTYPLKGADTRTYTTAVIHCDKAKVVFGAASLM
ncbi:DM13 domain-containing protein [Mycobacteroides abscessus]|uniref:DM13 domain-containing protein n=1 Tax=Mycobacteroides abscessus TaxID=36809 RepID=UPI0009A5CA1B|nr:DM13 domain-containing protein [Mycobacteroides abscessus]SLB14442.1 Electron transfer DM13 [Mycobacteroides abscessus subsp. massiliense]